MKPKPTEAPFKRGDYVTYKRRPTFRGMVVDVWPGGVVAWRATVQWENGNSSPCNQTLDLLPGEPFTTPQLKAGLRRRLLADRKTLASVKERVAWLLGVLKP